MKEIPSKICHQPSYGFENLSWDEVGLGGSLFLKLQSGRRFFSNVGSQLHGPRMYFWGLMTG